jgi:Flp pilus assembly protein TadD
MTLGDSDRLSEAEEAFRKEVAIEEGNARFVFNLGLILVRQNREAEARPGFQKALEIEPQFEEARRYLAETPANPRPR